MPYVTAREDHAEARGKREVAEPVDLGLDANADLLQLEIGPDRPKTRTARSRGNTQPQPTCARTPPTMMPRNEPTIAATMFIPAARGRAARGEGVGDALPPNWPSARAPPTAWNIRRMTSSRAPVEPVLQTHDSAIAPMVNQAKPRLYDPHAALHVADPADRHHNRCRHQQVAHHDPQQVGEAGRRQRIRWMPRKMTGRAMIRLVPLSVPAARRRWCWRARSTCSAADERRAHRCLLSHARVSSVAASTRPSRSASSPCWVVSHSSTGDRVLDRLAGPPR